MSDQELITLVEARISEWLDCDNSFDFAIDIVNEIKAKYILVPMHFPGCSHKRVPGTWGLNGECLICLSEKEQWKDLK